jgi:signal transduction histidine kinase/ActR/RegA family two-component response regulator
MTQSSGPRNQAPVATFHARVAGVGLITTVVVLLAACLTFMFQQWAVARTQSHQIHEALARITAATAAPAVLTRQGEHIQAPLSALDGSPSVVAARLTDLNGGVLASYKRAAAASERPTPTEVIRTDVLAGTQPVGRLTMTVGMPRLAPMLPQFIALTFVLLFGGVGVALFLARSLAHRVIAPVQRLSDAMNEVAAGGSFEPIEVEAQDELFRSLTTSFNDLLGKLGERENDLKRAMRELEVARDAADTANVLKTQFLANMSHEIRTPLNGVLAMAEVMAMGELAAVQRERLQVIRQSGGLLLAVLNDVLDLSKIEAGKLSLASEAFELQAVIAPVIDSFSVMARGKGLGFSLEVEEAAAGWWEGDPDRLRQIVGNLLSNAVKFTPHGEVTAVIDVNPQTDTIRLRVRDTGIGIAPDKLPTLFEKFTQADNSATRRFGGTGLGLAICRELTQMMGGSIDVESREGRGSTFTVELPLARAQQQEPASEPTTRSSEEMGLRLLAAEDNGTNQQVLAAVMESLGIDIDIVADGKLAVEAWRSCDYHLILMDIQMPVMDGIAAAQEIRAEERRSGRIRTPIIALTANALTHQVAEYMAVGMDGHVAKPIEIAKLYEAISTTLNAAATGGDQAAATHAA